MPGALVALLATALYFGGVAVFRVAADRMEPLRGTRLVHLVGQLLSNWIWYIGLIVLMSGVALQVAALYMIPLSIAQPLFVAALIFLLVIAMGYFGERLTGREWMCLAMIAVGTLVVGMSVAQDTRAADQVANLTTLAYVTVPSLLLPLAIFMLGDLSPAGRHARPVAGIAYGFGIGILTGMVELCTKGMANLLHRGTDPLDLLYSPYPYLLVVSGAMALGQLQIALQRCRMSIVIAVATVYAKTHLVLMSSILYGEPWPDDAINLVMRAGGLALTVLAVVIFPKYEDPQRIIGHPDTASARRLEP